MALTRCATFALSLGLFWFHVRASSLFLRAAFIFFKFSLSFLPRKENNPFLKTQSRACSTYLDRARTLLASRAASTWRWSGIVCVCGKGPEGNRGSFYYGCDCGYHELLADTSPLWQESETINVVDHRRLIQHHEWRLLKSLHCKKQSHSRQRFPAVKPRGRSQSPHSISSCWSKRFG